MDPEAHRRAVVVVEGYPANVAGPDVPVDARGRPHATGEPDPTTTAVVPTPVVRGHVAPRSPRHPAPAGVGVHPTAVSVRRPGDGCVRLPVPGAQGRVIAPAPVGLEIRGVVDDLPRDILAVLDVLPGRGVRRETFLTPGDEVVGLGSVERRRLRRRVACLRDGTIAGMYALGNSRCIQHRRAVVGRQPDGLIFVEVDTEETVAVERHRPRRCVEAYRRQAPPIRGRPFDEHGPGPEPQNRAGAVAGTRQGDEIERRAAVHPDRRAVLEHQLDAAVVRAPHAVAATQRQVDDGVLGLAGGRPLYGDRSLEVPKSGRDLPGSGALLSVKAGRREGDRQKDGYGEPAKCVRARHCLPLFSGFTNG